MNSPLEVGEVSFVAVAATSLLFQLLHTSVQVVEQLLSRAGALEKETAKSIADAAMLEVATISMGHMVCNLYYFKGTFRS